MTAAYRPSRYEMFVTAAAIWALCLVTFHIPGRLAPKEVDSLDLLAITKLAIRLLVIGVFLIRWRSSPDKNAKSEILAAYLPLLMFIGWGVLTVVWSPLKTVSLGQILGLAALTSLSGWIALAFRTETHTAFVVKHLWAAVLAFSTTILLVHIVQPGWSGLDREAELDGENGLVHPTAAGATAGIGFLLTLAAPKVVPGFRTGLATIPALACHAALLYLAQSRTALAMTGIASLLTLVWFYSTATRGKLLTYASGMLCLCLLLDPGFLLHQERLEASAEYVSRGQSTRQLSGISGRRELWEAVWEQIELAPWLGHGYFVTSKDGRLDVWDGPANHTAHNLALQVVVSTGILGAILFVAAGYRLLVGASLLRNSINVGRGVLWLAVIMGIWYAGWCQTCISFLGPVLPESVVFFVLLGLLVGQIVEAENLLMMRWRQAQ